MEGWDAGKYTRCRRNHNPGNLRYGWFAKAHGAVTDDDENFAIFPDDETGWNALIALMLDGNYATLTLSDAISRYAPSTENNTSIYLQSICEWTGSQPTDTVQTVMERNAGNPIDSVA